MRTLWVRLLAFALLVAPAAAGAAERTTKTFRVGLVSSTGNPRAPGPLVEAFGRRLRDLGYVEGKNIVLEYRYAEGRLERVPGFVDELVRLNVDALVVSSVPAIRAAKRATATIPIVMVISVDPVATGIVDSLARPGGNVMGVLSLNRDLRREAFELLAQSVPKLGRVGVLWNIDGRASALALKDYEAAAAARNVKVQSLEVRGATPDLAGAFNAAVKGRARGIVAVGDPVLARYPKRIAELALENRLPSISERDDYVNAGGLMDYSADYAENFRRLAVYVDRVLKGEKPGDLPIERSKFRLAVNLKTAKQIGVALPSSVIKRANKVIK